MALSPVLMKWSWRIWNEPALSIRGKSIFKRPNEESLKPKRIVFLSVEGTKTEVQYFRFIERFREKLGISAIVHVEVLQKTDTKSDPENVLELLEEYIQFRESKTFKTELANFELKKYDREFIKAYLENPSTISIRQRNKFESVLKKERIDLLYLDFLSKFQGEEDAFGIVIDRDCGSHSAEQINGVIKNAKKISIIVLFQILVWSFGSCCTFQMLQKNMKNS